MKASIQKLIIIRGIPGSGKTTLAQQLAPLHYYEADQWMVDADGNYDFDASRLHYAHSKCRQAVIGALNDGVETVVVSNTFTRRKEFLPYVKIAKRRGCDVEIVVATGNYQNVHGAPEEVVQRMRDQWED